MGYCGCLNLVNIHYYQTRGGTCGHTLVCVRIKSSTTNTLQQSDAQWPLPFSHTVLLSLLPPLRLEKRHAWARLAAEGGRLGEGQTGRKAEGRCGTQQCNRRSSAEGTLVITTAHAYALNQAPRIHCSNRMLNGHCRSPTLCYSASSHL